MRRAQFIRELEPTVMGQRKCLLKMGSSYYIISSIPSAPDHGGPETLAFAANKEGEITSWTDLAGGRGLSCEETIEQLEEAGPQEADGRVTDPLSALGVVFNPPSSDYYTKKGRR